MQDVPFFTAARLERRAGALNGTGEVMNELSAQIK